MDLHNDLDYDGNTFPGCAELVQALDNLEMADLEDECNIVAPKDNVEAQNEVEMVHDDMSDYSEVEVIDADTLGLESDLELDPISSQVMKLDSE
jgi:hypothetical protein